ncbi:Dihydrolipoyllysine-residue acetyltransferase component of pyruvate dehydrogenase complex [Aliiroseovarius pelagivivens]|uniref:Dihydrolipoamide acetyltransferase component of pyruvate dehydrogenase complex n=2 Tax=Aliiroseovarius pelagivivens TaxID=1639690 RepID=A0A2R8AIB9_9RHOB|nr:Dihydrolipoyllysine-residue acetyltransferase component of pyruvate dehydrogenase complex [Aliiroseovarius pelagivivens]
MPSLGADMEAGTLVEWLIKPGDEVHRGDVVAVVETQKGAIEIESFETGVVTELLASIGQTVPVGEELARFGPDDAPASPPAPAPTEKQPRVADTPEPAAQTIRPAAPILATGTRASPAARHAAHDLGLDLSTLQGSGPEGAVVLADVEAQAPSTPQTPPAKGGLSEMRQAVAAAMVRSKREIPHFSVSHTIETQVVSDWLALRNADRPPSERVLLGAAIVKATALAARSVKTLNGHFTDGAFVASDEVNIGVAIALRGGGLVAPALQRADTMTLDKVMTGMRDLVTRARAGRLRGSEMTRGTLTLSSLGEKGAETMTGVIFPPQVALLAVGAPQVRPWIDQGSVVPREVTTFTLSADHRVCDGRQGSKFLTTLEDLLSNPEEL